MCRIIIHTGDELQPLPDLGRLIFYGRMKKIDNMLTVDEVIVQPPEPGRLRDFKAIFGRDMPVEMAIGTGKGGFLLNRAQRDSP